MKPTANLADPIVDHMRLGFTRLTLGETVGGTLDLLRREPPTDRVLYFYVVDADRRLRGVVPTRQLLLSAPDRRVDDIMVTNVVAIPAAATVRDACELFALHRFLGLPVIDTNRRLVGVVGIDLYTDELDQLDDSAKRNDLFQTLGVYAGREDDASPIHAFGRRFPWLLSNLIGGLTCAAMASMFQSELSRVVALALFIPVVLNLAESVSSQAVSLTLHRLHGRTPTRRFVRARFGHEVATAALLGIACGVVVALVELMFLRQTTLALSLLAGITAGVTVSGSLGMIMPVALRQLRLDPKVAAGPIALAGADVATLLAYLGCARWFLR